MQYDLTPTQRAVQAQAREMARGKIAERAAEIDCSEEYPWDNVALLKEAGYFGMTIPVAYGGHGQAISTQFWSLKRWRSAAASPAASSSRPIWARSARS